MILVSSYIQAFLNKKIQKGRFKNNWWGNYLV